MDNNGELVGGVVGYMKTLAKLVKDLYPKKVIVVWESGGSPRRRQLLPEYKEHRKPPRPMNRTYGDAIPDTEDNKNYQIRCIIQLLRYLPICQVYVENCEADDVIGYLVNNTYKDHEKIIVSSDKDYYQLLDEKTKIFTPGKKVFVKKENVIEDYKILPENFCIAKALSGDNSDNIPGVPRVGFKSLAKRFDLLTKITTLDEVISISNQHVLNDKKPLVIYENIVQHADMAKRNMQLVKLDDRLLSFDQINKIVKIINEYNPKWSKIKFFKKYTDLNLDGLHIERLCNCFSYLQYTNKPNGD